MPHAVIGLFYLSPRPPAAGGESRQRQQGKCAGGGFGDLVHVEVDHRADVFAVFGNGDEGAAPAHVAASALVREGLHPHLQILVNGGSVVAAAEGDTQPVEALAHVLELWVHAGEVDGQAVAGELHVLDVGDVEGVGERVFLNHHGLPGIAVSRSTLPPLMVMGAPFCTFSPRMPSIVKLLAMWVTPARGRVLRSESQINVPGMYLPRTCPWLAIA